MPFDSREKRNANQNTYRARKREEAMGAGTGDPPGGGADPPPEAQPAQPMPLDTVADALAILCEEVNRVRADTRGSPQIRGRTIAYLLSVAAKLIHDRDYDAKLEAIMAVLRPRAEQKEKRK